MADPKQIEEIETAYAVHQVAEIDRRLAAMDEEKARLVARRKVFEPHLPKRRSRAAKDAD